MKNIILLISALTPAAHAGISSDCAFSNADSTCASEVHRASVHLPPPVQAIYDGPIAGAPTIGSGYWGFDFAAAAAGISSPVPRDMYVNRSTNAISLLFSFDLPSGPCGDGCRPGMEFKLNASWVSFFPNIIISGRKALTTLQVAPGQAFGFVIALWASSNPHVKIDNLGTAPVELPDVGLSDFSVATPIEGQYFQCSCGDGRLSTCYSGTRYSNGLMGQWYRDGYSAWDAAGCN